MQVEYLREKISQYQVPLEYLFSVKQQRCSADGAEEDESEEKIVEEDTRNEEEKDNEEELNATVDDLFEGNEEANEAETFIENDEDQERDL